MSLHIVSFPSRNRPVAAEDRERDVPTTKWLSRSLDRVTDPARGTSISKRWPYRPTGEIIAHGRTSATNKEWSGSKITIAVPVACAVAWLLMVMWEVW